MRDFNSAHGIAKDVTVGDVHVATALGNGGRKGKKRRMISTITGPKDVTALAGVDLNKDELSKSDMPPVGRVEVRGIKVAIETEVGSKRYGSETPLLANYGRIEDTMGADGDQLDAFTGDELDQDKAYVINEGRPDGVFHQTKLMLGFPKKKKAIAAYDSGKFPGRLMLSIIKTTVDEVKAWVATGDTVGPYGDDTLSVEKKAALEGAEGRSLEPFARGMAKNPLPVMRHALGHVRPDQAPRLFQAMTKPHTLDTHKMKIDDLTAIQDRIEPTKVKAMMEGVHNMDKRPVVVRFSGRNFVVDGNHHIAARWLMGKDKVKVKFSDISPKSEALKRMDPTKPLEGMVLKADADKQWVFGWASVSTIGGELVVDKQGESIEIDELENAAYDFVLNSRDMGHMHTEKGVGQLIESCVFSKQKQDMLGIELPHEGWLVGFKVTDQDVWKSIKSGKLPELSIGGVAIPVESD